MIGALIFVALILGGWCFWLTWDRQAIADQLDEVRDDANLARADAAHARAEVRAAIDHITDTGSGSGRHHQPDKPRPWPRATVRSET